MLMKRSLFGLLVSLTTIGCLTTGTTKPPVVPPKPPASVGFCSAPDVHDATTGNPIAGADVYISTLEGHTNSQGYVYLAPVPGPTNELEIYATGYVDYKQTIPIASWSCDVSVNMVPLRGPRPTRAQTMNIAANFLSLHDVQGRLMFSWFYPTLGDADRALWRQAYIDAKVTHVVLDPAPCYPGFWAPCADYRGNPTPLVSASTELLNHNFIPIVMMTTGDAGTQGEPDTTWPGIVNAFRASEPCVIGEAGDPCAVLALGFETGGPCSAWTAAQISHAITVGHQLAPNAIWAWEGCPERFSGVSNPPQADDPWHSNEDAFWNSNGGENFQIMLYETPHGPKLLDPAGATGQFCHLESPCGAYEDRFVEGLQGHGFGGRHVPISFFEVTGSDYKGGGVSDATVLRINNRALRLCQQYGQTCSFGNGIPTGPQ
jgi:hypothetical protein